MKIYRVGRKEVHVSFVEIEAESEEDARKKVADAEGEEISFEYDYTMDNKLWSVEEAQ